jgi:Cellulase (glycosyl hydrolase family 5)
MPNTLASALPTLSQRVTHHPLRATNHLLRLATAACCTWLAGACASDDDHRLEQPITAGDTGQPAPQAGATAQTSAGATAGRAAQAGNPAQAGSATPPADAGAVAPTFAGRSGGAGAAAAAGGGEPAGAGGALAPPQAGSAAGGGAVNAPPGACRPKFGSGLNVAWFKFAGDVPNPDIARFTQLFKDTYDAGGRVVRWWFHTNGTVTPGYDGKGLAKPIGSDIVADVSKILDAAHAAGVSVVVSLWSFDMLQGNQSAPLDNNYALLTQDANRQSYIDNVLTPLVTGLKAHPGLYGWEIFNEPEGMTSQNGWTTQSGGKTVDESVVQICVNWFADAIHKADPSALVTNGAWQFAVNANVSSYKNLYSDTALRAVGKRQSGTLDFYEVHYYANWNGSEVVSPFTHPVSYWNVDKAVQIGEFWATATNNVPADSLYTNLFDSGYKGAWAWQYANEDSGGGTSTKWPAMRVPMQKLYQAHGADLECAAGH